MKKKSRILLEVAFFIGIYLITSNLNTEQTRAEKILGLCVYLLLYAFGFFNRFVILPFLFPQKKYLKYFSITIVLVLAFSALLFQIDIYYSKIYNPTLLPFLTFYNSVSNCMFSLLLMSSIEFVFQYFKQEQEKQKYNDLIRNLENNNLKAQLNPHFLFNSLNNAYGISLTDPARAPEYIMQLSQLMRYQIESTKNTYVVLKEEIEFIENYLAVEGERIGTRCTIVFNNIISDDCQKKLNITPMLLMTYIENAIKHGSASIDPSSINIQLQNTNNELDFKIVNSIPKKNISVIGTGTGLINANQRLQMMYTNKHSLTIENKNFEYRVHLKITL